jgi:hypothetical protein
MASPWYCKSGSTVYTNRRVVDPTHPFIRPVKTRSVAVHPLVHMVEDLGEMVISNLDLPDELVRLSHYPSQFDLLLLGSLLVDLRLHGSYLKLHQTEEKITAIPGPPASRSFEAVHGPGWRNT